LAPPALVVALLLVVVALGVAADVAPNTNGFAPVLALDVLAVALVLVAGLLPDAPN
jgi:hypothetical protein